MKSPSKGNKLKAGETEKKLLIGQAQAMLEDDGEQPAEDLPHPIENDNEERHENYDSAEREGGAGAVNENLDLG